MFVRFQKRKQGDGYRWVAQLVESKRVDGKPRQRHVAFLGSILDKYIQHARPRQHFWESVQSRLPDLPAKERRAIEKRIAEKVPVPTKREIAAAERDFNKMMQRIVSRLRG